jgi:putative peptidoglycan lipid II flippase
MNLHRTLITVSGMTMLSRITGLIREVLVARTFGASVYTDAFFVAFRIPNLLRRLFAEGAFSQAFVPILAEYKNQQGNRATRILADHVATVMFWVLLVTSIAGIVFAPVIVLLVASGFASDPLTMSLSVSMTRIMFPYILFMSLVALAGGILNTLREFRVPAFTPVLLNLSFIAAALFLAPLMSQPVYALAIAVLVGGVLQLAIQIPALRRVGMLPRIGLNPFAALRDEGVRRVLKQMLPATFAVSAAQISLIINTNIASHLADGSVSWLSYADRLMELPLGIIGIAIATVILPTLSRIHSRGDTAEFAHTLDWGLRCIVVMGLPSSVALVSLAHPLIITLYQRGEFGIDSVGPTALSLQAYSLGLLAFMAIKVLASAYFSRQDTKTPVRYGVIAMVSNMVLNLLLLIPLAHVGLALATSLSAFINAGLLWWGLHRKAGIVPGAGWGALLLRVVAALLCMLLVLQLLSQPDAVWIAWSDLQRAARLAVICAAGGLAYLAALWVGGLRLAHFRV